MAEPAVDPGEVARRVQQMRAGGQARPATATGVDAADMQRRIEALRGAAPPASPAVAPTTSPGFFDRAAEFIGDQAGAVKRAVTGEEQLTPEIEGLPELQSQGFGFQESLKLAAAHMTAAEPIQIAEIAEKTLPDVKRRTDAKGNLILTLPNGQDVAVNRPGLSGADVFKFISDMVQFLPAARVSAFVKGLLPRSIVAGLGFGATSVGQDLAAEQLGSEQGVDFTRAGFTAVLGLGGELGAPLAMKLVRKIPLGRKLVTPDGRLNQRGRDFVEATGIDPDTVTPESAQALDHLARRFSRRELNAMTRRAARTFDDEAKQATGAAGVLSAAEQQSGRIPLTSGQQSGNLRQLAREEAMRNVARGGPAAETIRRFDRRQTEAIRDRAGRDQARLSGGQAQAEDALGAAGQVQGSVQNQATALGRQVDDAFGEVRRLPDARLNVTSLRQLNQGVRDVLKERGAIIDRKLTPGTVDTLQEFGRLARQARGPARINKLTLKSFERQRRKINARIDDALGKNNKQDAGHLLAIKRAHDNFIDEAFDNELFSGDPTTLAVLKDARAKRAEFGQLFEARGKGDDAGKIIEKIVDGDRTNLEVANWLFGNAQIAQLGQRGSSVRLVKRLREILPEEDFNALREGVWHRLIYGNTQRRAEELGLQRMHNDLGEALEGKGREFMAELFSEEEMNAFRSFRREIGRALPERLAGNSGQSGFEVARLLQDVLAKFPLLLGIVTGNPAAGAAAAAAGGVARAVSNRGAAEAAVRGVAALPSPQISPLFRAGIGAGAAATVRENRTTPR